MILAYLWLDKSDLKPEENLGYNLYGKYTFNFNKDENTLYIRENENYIDDFYKINGSEKTCIDSLTCIVGENGAGKTTLLNNIVKVNLTHSDKYFDKSYLAIWINNKKTNKLCFFFKDNMSLKDLIIKNIENNKEISIKKLNSIKSSLPYIILYNNYLADYIEFENDELLNKSFEDLRTNILLKTHQKNVNISGWLKAEQLNCYKSEEMKAKIYFCLDKNKFNNFNILSIKQKNKDFETLTRDMLVIETREYLLKTKLQKFIDSIKLLKKEKLLKNYLEKVEDKFNNKIEKLKQILDLKKINSSKIKFDLYIYYKWLLSHSYWLLIIDSFTDFLKAVYTSDSIIKYLENELDSNLETEEPIIYINNIIYLIVNLLRPSSKNIYLQKEDIKNIKNLINNEQVFQKLLDYYEQLVKKDLITFVKKDNNIYSQVKLEQKNTIIANFVDTYAKSLFNLNGTDYIEFSWKPQLSSGENALFTLFARLHKAFKKINKKQLTRILILLDEAEIGFHPAWQKKYIYSLIKYINLINTRNIKVQLILTTNNPIPLSDIQPSDVIYLESHKVKELKNKKAFGTDLLTLYSDSFFIKDGLIGKFADSKIKELINECKNKKKFSKEELSYYTQLANIVGDNFIKQYLLELIQNKEKTND